MAARDAVTPGCGRRLGPWGRVAGERVTGDEGGRARGPAASGDVAGQHARAPASASREVPVTRGCFLFPPWCCMPCSDVRPSSTHSPPPSLPFLTPSPAPAFSPAACRPVGDRGCGGGEGEGGGRGHRSRVRRHRRRRRRRPGSGSLARCLGRCPVPGGGGELRPVLGRFEGRLPCAANLATPSPPLPSFAFHGPFLPFPSPPSAPLVPSSPPLVQPPPAALASGRLAVCRRQPWASHRGLPLGLSLRRRPRSLSRHRRPCPLSPALASPSLVDDSLPRSSTAAPRRSRRGRPRAL